MRAKRPDPPPMTSSRWARRRQREAALICAGLLAALVELERRRKARA
jgi:hypothetical protein